MKIFILSFFISLVSCTNQNSTNKVFIQNNNDCSIPLSRLILFLDNNIDSINDIECLLLRDTIIEYEDVDWPAKLAYNKQSKVPVFLFETNWEDTINISRISLLSPNGIVSDKTIGDVGLSFTQIKNIINPKRLNDAPDGYLYLFNKINEHISYVMAISNDSPLSLGIKSINDIPDTLKVKSIVLTKLN